MSKGTNREKRLIIKGHQKNPFVRFWNWGWNIYYKKPEIWNYLIVGLFTTIVSLATYFLLTNTILDVNNAIELQIANITSWILAVLFAYVTNRKFVFNSKNENIKEEFFKFVASRIASLLLDMATMFIMVSLLSINDGISKLTSQIVVLITNYIFSKIFVFKK